MNDDGSCSCLIIFTTATYSDPIRPDPTHGWTRPTCVEVPYSKIRQFSEE